MKKEYRNLFLLIIPIFIILFFISLVSAQDTENTAKEIVKKVTNSGEEIFNKVFGITLTGEPIWELAVTKFLLMLLIFSIVYGIADILVLDTTDMKTTLKVIFSVVVSYLSVIYLAPAEIYAALSGWGAMAVTITAIVPFAVILTLSWKLASNPNPAKMFIQKLLLGIFAIYLIFRVFALIWFSEKITNAWPFAITVYGTALIITLIILIANKTIQRFILTTQVSGYLQISDALNKEEALAEVIILKEKSAALAKVGAHEAATKLMDAADNLEDVAKRKFK